MKIGMMADIYTPHISGVTHHIAMAKRFIEEAGHEVSIFTFGDPAYPETEPNVYRSPGWPIANSGFHLGLRHSRRVQQLLRTMDIIHVHHPFLSGRLALRYRGPAGIPIIFTHHTRYDLYLQHYLPVVPEGMGQVLLRNFFMGFFRQCSLIIAPSPEVSQLLQHLGPQAPMEVIPNGVDLEPFRTAEPSPLREELGLEPEDTVAVYLGRLGPEKNLLMLLEALRQTVAECPWLHLILIGGGPEQQALEAYSQRDSLAGRVHFLGPVPYPEVPALLRAADFFVTASVSEIHPLSVIEAMAAGLPVLGVDSPGMSSLIKDEENGFLSPPDPAAFAALLARLGRQPALRHQLGEGARRHAEGYDVRNTTRLLLDRYTRLLTPV